MMMNRPFVTGLLALSLFACAADPNKQANDAHDAELTSQREATQNNAEERREGRVNAAETTRENTDATATGSTATQDRVSADAELTEARAIHRAKATERLEKADARAAELNTLIAKAGGRATTASRDAMKVAATQRAMVTRELDQLPRTTSDAWGKAKTSLDTQLDTLEGLVKKAATEVDRFAK